MSDAIPVCCYCDAPLSCARCGCEQPADDVSHSQISGGATGGLHCSGDVQRGMQADREELEAALRDIAGRSWHPANVRLGDIARAAIAPEQDR